MTGHDSLSTPDGEPAYWTTREHGKGLNYFQNLGDGKYFLKAGILILLTLISFDRY